MSDLAWYCVRMFSLFSSGVLCGYCIGYPIKKSDDRKLAELGKRIDAIERERISNLDYRQLECDSCRAKPGTPELCASCLRVRQYVCDTLEGE